MTACKLQNRLMSVGWWPRVLRSYDVDIRELKQALKPCSEERAVELSRFRQRVSRRV